MGIDPVPFHTPQPLRGRAAVVLVAAIRPEPEADRKVLYCRTIQRDRMVTGVYVEGVPLMMRERPRNLLLLVGLFGGVARGLAALGALNGAEGVLLLVVAAAAFGCAVAGAFAVRGIRRARRDVVRILRLRASGTAYAGTITALPDPRTWNHGGDVPVRYRDGGDGPEHTVTVHVNTWAHEIPVPGTRVIVRRDEGGDLLVELDPAQGGRGRPAPHPPVIERRSFRPPRSAARAVVRLP
ncbi:hypothetical protein ACWC1D_08235 [Streptomyces sp. NPDC001478]